MPYPKGTMLQRIIKCKKINTPAHHIGIYIGNNEVIHFGFPAKNAIVKTSLKRFSDGEKTTAKQYPTDDDHACNICKVSEVLLSSTKNIYNKKYNLFFNNCEDFARECYGNSSPLIMDQWETMRGNVGKSLSKTTGHIIKGVGTAAQQLGKSQAGVLARGAIKSTVKGAYSTQVGKKVIETITKNTLGKSVSGGAAINSASKLARGNVVIGTLTAVALTGPDIYRAIIDKSVSWQQVSKNLVSNGAMVAGGIGGWAGGAAIGTAIFPGVGTIVGGIVGSVAAATVAEKVSKTTMDLICDDDSKQMLTLVHKTLIKLCVEFQFTDKEVTNNLMPKVSDKIDEDWLREMYKSGSTDLKRSKFAYSQLKGICHEVQANKQKKKLTKPSADTRQS